MYRWNPTISIIPGGWGTAPSDAWRNWKLERLKASGRKIIITEHTDDTSLELNYPQKIIHYRKGSYLIYFICIL